MKQHVMWLLVTLFVFLSAPAVPALASDTEVEIELMEVSGFIRLCLFTQL